MRLRLTTEFGVLREVEGARCYLKGFEWLECYLTFDPVQETWSITEPRTGLGIGAQNGDWYKTAEEAEAAALRKLQEINPSPEAMEQQIQKNLKGL